MKLLHTSDWHLCKQLHGQSRDDEYRAVLEEVVGMADDHEVDLVVHSGDLFDRAMPPPDAVGLALDALVRLTGGGARPVVVVAGNHDNPRLFSALAPILEPLGVHLVGELRPPGDGGVLDLAIGDERALVSCVPWVSQGRVVDFMDDPGSAYGTYADKMRAIVAAHREHVAGEGAVTILAAHFMVGGVKVRGGNGPTGMKELSIGEAYAATEAAVNHDFSYVALGHIHLPQRVPGAPSGEYAGSLLQLDFGEAGETKRVVVVEATPGRAATAESVDLEAGRPLMQASGTFVELGDRTDLDDAWLDLTVETDGPPLPATIEAWRERFPRAVKLAARFPTEEDEGGRVVGNRGLDDLYDEYHRVQHGEPAPELIDLMRDLLAEAEA